MARQAKSLDCFILATLVSWVAVPAFAADNEPLSQQVQSLRDSNNAFALDLYARLGSGESGNLFFSPTSISTALAMTYAGAAGTTETEIGKALHFEAPSAQTHAAFAALMATLNAPDKSAYELRIANRLWGQTGYGFLPDYLAVTRKYYGAELAQVDFATQSEGARRQINDWVEEQTNQKIKDLIPSGALNSMTRLVLTNAVYFKGKWRHEFDPKATETGPFFTSKGKEVPTPFMSQKQHFPYAETETLQILELPYQGDDLSMVVLLPKKATGLADLERQLQLNNLKKWLTALRRTEVRTQIPRFKLTEEFELKSVLAALGMPAAFDPQQADFSKMNGKRDLFLSAVIHKAFVDVNEEGTEAAAATGIVVRTLSLAPEPKVFRADHPFVFLLRDRRTGSILFLGRVTNPQS